MSSKSERRQMTRVRHGKLRRSSGWVNGLKVLLTAVLALGLSGVATTAYAVWYLQKDLNTVTLAAPKQIDPNLDVDSKTLDGAFSVLLVGSDSRAGSILDDGEEGELNDVNLLLHVSADHQNATVISFPRDLMVPFPSCPGPNGEPNYTSAMSEQQINSALSVGGLPCAAATISELTGMDVPYAGLVTFDGVIEMTNAIGGVEVCLAEPIDDPMTGLVLPAGNNWLVGLDALQFLRTRYGVGDGGDTSRISNQQVFMSAMMRQLKDGGTLSDPIKVFGLAKAAVENMTLSDNMADIAFMQAAASTVKNIDLERINFVQYPTSTHPYQAGRLMPDRYSAQPLIDAVLSGQAFDVTGVGKGATDAPVEEAAPPVEGEIPLVEGEAPIEGEAPAVDPNAPVQLPSNITGQRADKQTCSAGRTDF